MSLEKRVEATAKNLEGKVQEAVGELTGDRKQTIEGQVKQAQASAMHVQEDLKDEAKRIIDRA
ncbi:MAG: CsbD family protein [Cyanobacteriota bacterium]